MIHAIDKAFSWHMYVYKYISKTAKYFVYSLQKHPEIHTPHLSYFLLLQTDSTVT